MHEYKVGDWICETWSSSPDKTKAYQITRIDLSLVYYARGKGTFVSPSKVRLALPNEIPIEFRPKLSKEQKNNILKLIKEI